MERTTPQIRHLVEPSTAPESPVGVVFVLPVWDEERRGFVAAGVIPFVDHEVEMQAELDAWIATHLARSNPLTQEQTDRLARIVADRR